MKNPTPSCCCSPIVETPFTSGGARTIFKSIDRVTWAIVIVLVTTAWISTAQFQSTLIFVIKSYQHLWPYLIFTFASSAYLKAASLELLVARLFTWHPRSAIVAASLFGALSPLCSCGVIPLISVLLRSRVALGVVMAFWLSSPIISPASYFLTVGVLGFEFANFRFLSAITIGLVAGFLTWKIKDWNMIKNPLSKSLTEVGSDLPTAESLQPEWRFWKFSERRKSFTKEFGRSSIFFAKWLTLAFILESILVNHLPKDALQHILGPTHLFAIPLASLIGVPAYLNSTAAVPLLQLFIDSGVAPGAALAFLAAGAVTSLPALLAVFPLVRRGVFLWYLALALIGSVAVGYVYQGYVFLMGF